jgi:ABC-type multidrug transport system fused ATPase/permease subunit
LDTDAINLNALRLHVTIIPQDPILLSGTLRFNLDPFGEHEDYELYGALNSSGLDYAGGMAGSSGTATPTVLTLETQISSGGSNLSQGQRQLVALARALVRGSKILVLDEATASVDHATDALVQQAIRSQHGVTILTVAHRLSTIMDYDKVIVLGAGKLLEYDTPANLLKNSEGYFRALVNDSSDKAELERLANGGTR